MWYFYSHLIDLTYILNTFFLIFEIWNCNQLCSIKVGVLWLTLMPFLRLLNPDNLPLKTVVLYITTSLSSKWPLIPLCLVGHFRVFYFSYILCSLIHNWIMKRIKEYGIGKVIYLNQVEDIMVWPWQYNLNISSVS